jgi:hypothetical protein
VVDPSPSIHGGGRHSVADLSLDVRRFRPSSSGKGRESPLSPSLSATLTSSSMLPFEWARRAEWARAILSSKYSLSSPSLRLSAGFLCTFVSAALSSAHLLPLYATQKAGLLRLLPLTPYVLSLNVGLLSCTLGLALLVSLSRRAVPAFTPSIIVPSILCGVALSLSSYFLSSYMPSNAGTDFSWYYYSEESDALAMAWFAVPLLVITTAAWMVWREHQITAKVDVEDEDAEVEEWRRTIVDDEEKAVVEVEEVQPRVRSGASISSPPDTSKAASDDFVRVVSWSNVSLWTLAVVLGTVAEGIAVIAWDEGY